MVTSSPAMYWSAKASSAWVKAGRGIRRGERGFIFRNLDLVLSESVFVLAGY